jgi:hypothetical protein
MMHVLPLIESLPQLFSMVPIDDGTFAMVAMLLGTAGGIKLTNLREKAKARREDFIRKRRGDDRNTQ